MSARLICIIFRTILMVGRLLVIQIRHLNYWHDPYFRLPTFHEGTECKVECRGSLIHLWEGRK